MLANPDKGEVVIKVDGNEYIGKLDIRAHRALEERLGLGSMDIIQKIDEGHVEHFICMLWVALRKRHPEITEDIIEGWVDEHSLFHFSDSLKALITNSTVWSKKKLAQIPTKPEAPSLEQTESQNAA